jgi:hypothetical protein
MPWGDKRYWTELYDGNCFEGAVKDCNPWVGKKTNADPYGYIDGPPSKAGSSYFSVSAGGVRAFAALMILFPEFKAIVNTTAPIEYADRIGRHGVWAYPDPVAAPSVVDQNLVDCSPWKNEDDCNDYRKTWGPRLDDGRFAVENGLGRFTSTHGEKPHIGYPVGAIERDWDKIIALYNGPTYEDRFTPLGTCVAPDIFVYPENGKLWAFLDTGTPLATIRYTTDGSAPDEQSPIYSAVFETSDPNLIRAAAFRADLQTSKISSLGQGVVKNSSTPSAPSNLNSETPY